MRFFFRVVKSIFFRVSKMFTKEISADVENYSDLQEETSLLHNILTQLSRYQEDKNLHAGQRWKLPPNGQPITLFSGIPGAVKTVIRPNDDSKRQNYKMSLYL